jgi:hypothetical protein
MSSKKLKNIENNSITGAVKKKDGVLLCKYMYLRGITKETLVKTCQRRNSCLNIKCGVSS